MKFMKGSSELGRLDVNEFVLSKTEKELIRLSGTQGKKQQNLCNTKTLYLQNLLQTTQICYASFWCDRIN